ncbi:hypothetical protein D3C85_1650080 [compost metagenome]
MLKPVTRTSPSTLLVPPSTLPSRVVSSATLTVSLPSLKSSVTGVTLMLRVELSLLTPSLTV